MLSGFQGGLHRGNTTPWLSLNGRGGSLAGKVNRHPFPGGGQSIGPEDITQGLGQASPVQG